MLYKGTGGTKGTTCNYSQQNNKFGEVMNMNRKIQLQVWIEAHRLLRYWAGTTCIGQVVINPRDVT